MPTEAIIRDFLAAHLHLLEPGLKLIRVEYPVANPNGAAGKIDILAQDPSKMLVVIEIKKSDKSARETIHELEKYTALLLAIEGHGPSQVRCIIASTHWHELHVPYSHFTQHAPYTVDGYLLIHDESGEVLECKQITPLPKSQRRQLCPHHFVFGFGTPKQLDRGIKAVQAAFSEIEVENYMIAAFEPKPQYVEELDPYIIYIVIEVLPETMPPSFERAFARLRKRNGPEEYDDPEWSREDAAFDWVCTKLRRSQRIGAEIGYPEKLSEVRSVYSLSHIVRSGRLLRARDTLPDDELLLEAEGHVDGRSPQFTHKVNTRHHAARLNFCDAARDCLGKNTIWRAGFDWVMAQIPEGGDWLVSANIVNTMDFVGQFYACLREGQAGYLPHLELQAIDQSSNFSIFVEGAVCWNGNPVNESFDNIAKHSFGQHDYSLRKLTFSLDEVEYTILEAMQLSYALRLQRGLPAQTSEEWEMSVVEDGDRTHINLIPFAHSKNQRLSSYIEKK